MAKIENDQLLIPSVLDRLIDNEPEVSRETPHSRNQVLREMKFAVRRDLENLLNTRWRCKDIPAHLTELDVSLVNYGIPDFTGMNLGSVQDREKYRRLLEGTIRKYEPRFRKVQVRLVDSDAMDRTLHFRIDAILHADAAPVVFDTSLEPSTGTFEVRGARR
ncbi:MAG: type VI secretion system baseplate subunit TssE [Planctomycetota bacterium]